MRFQLIMQMLVASLSVSAGAMPSVPLPPAEQAVAQSGAAALEIPIPVPPGTGGFQPNLRLRYSSQGGDGPFGVGWSLNLSEIQRSTRFGAPTFDDAQDRFELDGVRLIPPLGSGDRYYAFSDRFQRIIRKPATGVIQTWEVTAPNGITSIYGAAVPAQGIMRWLLTEQKDAAGNRICFDYDELPAQSNSFLLVAVTYTHRSACESSTSTQGETKRIEFHYENRPDDKRRFSGGFDTNLTKRASEILASVNGVARAKITLAYSSDGDYSTVRSRLVGVQRLGCNGDCDDEQSGLPETLYTYTDPDDLGQSTSLWTGGATQPALPFPIEEKKGQGARDLGWRTADLDADGRPELVRAYRDQDENGVDTPVLDVFRYAETGFYRDDDWTDALRSVRFDTYLMKVTRSGSNVTNIEALGLQNPPYFAQRRDWWEPLESGPEFIWYMAPANVRLVDVNGDGRADLIASYRAVDAHYGSNSAVVRHVVEVHLNNGLTWEKSTTLSRPYDDQTGEGLPPFESYWFREGGSKPKGDVKCAFGQSPCAAWIGLIPAGTFFADVDGNSRIDVLQRTPGDCGPGSGDLPNGAWLQGDSGFQINEDFLPPIPSVQSFDYDFLNCIDYGVRYVDVNGDGLADMVRGSTNRQNGNPPIQVEPVVYLSTGLGWASASAGDRYTPPTPFVMETGEGFFPQQVIFADLNRDGLVDVASGLEDDRKAWLQNGKADSQCPKEKWSTGNTIACVWKRADRFAPPINMQAVSTVNFAERHSSKGVTYGDFDGNGTLDFLKHWDNNTGTQVETAYGTDLFSDRVAVVDNGEGAHLEFEYVSLVAQRDPTADLALITFGDAAERGELVETPVVAWRDHYWPTSPVVSSVRVETNLGGPFEASYPFAFSYEGSQWDPSERVPFGPRARKVIRPDNSTDLRLVYQSHGIAGQLSRRDIVSAEGSSFQTREDWEQVFGAPANGSRFGAILGRLAERTTSTRDAAGDFGAAHTTSYAYDDCGGSLFNFPCRIEVRRPSGDATILRTPTHLQGAWVLGLVGTEEVFEQVPATGARKRSVTNQYHTSGGGTGKLLRTTREALFQGLPAIPGGISQVEEVFGYDDYGNLTSHTDPLQRQTQFRYDGDSASCDPRGTSHSLLVETQDAAGGKTCADRDPFFGAGETVVRFNGDMIVQPVDLYGRIQSVAVVPRLTGETHTLETRSYPLGANRVESTLYADDEKTYPIQTSQQMDGLGRVVREVGPGARGGFSGIARRLDYAGRPVEETLPVPCATFTCNEATVGGSNPLLTRTYDGLGRLTETSSIGETYEVERYGTTISSFPAAPKVPGTGTTLDRIVMRDPEGNVVHQLRDGERTLWVEECEKNSPGETCGGAASTYYTFEITGEVRAIYHAGATPGSSNRFRTEYAYDTLGQVRSISDPDGTDADDGTRSLQYDAGGRLDSQTNVRGQLTSYRYDSLDRLEYRYRGPASGTPDVTITYDDPSTENPAGTRQRKSVTGSGYTYDYGYDEFGGLGLEKLTIEGEEFITRFRYDLLGRITKILYPVESTNVAFNYQGAHLVKVCDEANGVSGSCSPSGTTWIQNAIYDGNGVLEDLAYASGHLGYVLDAKRRLEYFRFSSSQSGNLNLRYGYDNVGNVTSIADNSAGLGDSVASGATLAYDDRSRLVEWTPERGTLRSFGYDALGNLTSRGTDAGTQLQHYDNLENGAHVLDRVTRPGQATPTASFTYDADGNRKWDPLTLRRFSYDDDGMLTKVEHASSPTSAGGGEIASHTYDLDGRRIRSVLNGVTHVYVGELFEWSPPEDPQDPDARGESVTFVHAFGQLIGTRYLDETNLRADAVPGGILPFEVPPWLPVALALAGSSAFLLYLGVAMELRRRPLAGGLSIVLVLAVVTLPAHGTPPPPSPGDGAVVRHHVADPLGSAVLAVKPDGTFVSRRAFEPYGQVFDPPPWSTEETEQRFAGQRFEYGAQLYDYHARWYDPGTGTFLSVDPVIASLTDPQQHNAYAYARGNPTNNIDPTGMQCVVSADDFGNVGNLGDCGEEDPGPTYPSFGVPIGFDNSGYFGEQGPGSLAGHTRGSNWSPDIPLFMPQQDATFQLTFNPNAMKSQGRLPEYYDGPFGMVFPDAEAQQSFGLGIAAVALTAAPEVALAVAARYPSAYLAVLSLVGGPKLFNNQFPGDPLVTPKVVELSKVTTGRLSLTLNYVVTATGRLILGRTNVGGHIDLAGGGPVRAAGVVRFVDGAVHSINNASGHYMPSGFSARAAAEAAFGITGKYKEIY